MESIGTHLKSLKTVFVSKMCLETIKIPKIGQFQAFFSVAHFAYFTGLSQALISQSLIFVKINSGTFHYSTKGGMGKKVDFFFMK